MNVDYLIPLNTKYFTAQRNNKGEYTNLIKKHRLGARGNVVQNGSMWEGGGGVSIVWAQYETNPSWS